jgi:hypothetical protein
MQASGFREKRRGMTGFCTEIIGPDFPAGGLLRRIRFVWRYFMDNFHENIVYIILFKERKAKVEFGTKIEIVIIFQHIDVSFRVQPVIEIDIRMRRNKPVLWCRLSSRASSISKDCLARSGSNIRSLVQVGIG